MCRTDTTGKAITNNQKSILYLPPHQLQHSKHEALLFWYGVFFINVLYY